jgi:Flp pilus assembly pilin Flp
MLFPLLIVERNTMNGLSPREDVAVVGRIRRILAPLAGEDGAATAEYAIATLAAVGLAGLLVAILRGDEVKAMLTDLIHRALTISG